MKSMKATTESSLVYLHRPLRDVFTTRFSLLMCDVDQYVDYIGGNPFCPARGAYGIHGLTWITPVTISAFTTHRPPFTLVLLLLSLVIYPTIRHG